MSLLIKALKRAEQKHDEAKLASENEAAAETVDQTAEHNAIQIELNAVDTEDTELAMELAQMQLAQASPSELNSTDDIKPIPLPELNLSVESADARSKSVQEPAGSPNTSLSYGPDGTLAADGTLASAGPAGSTGTGVPPVKATRLALELEGAPLATAAITSAQSPASDLSNPAKSANRPAAGSTAPQSFSQVDHPNHGSRARFLVYSMLGLSVAACLGWFTLNMLGFNFNKANPRPSTSAPITATPASGLEAPGNEEKPKADSTPTELESRVERATEPAREKPATAANAISMAPSRNSRSTESGKSAVTGPKPGTGQANPSKQQSNSAASIVNPAPSEGVPNQSATNPDARIPVGTPAGIRLSRSETFAEQTLKMNERAWQLLSRNEKAAARSVYEEVLRLDRNNGDAWLGLASIAVKLGDPASAELHYKKALDIDPNDVAAKAGLLSLRSNHEPNQQESRLRHLLEQGGGQPALLFALGNSLASQARWADAQQAYFAAYTADQGNADYAFNLAVTLERLRQPQAAANHYRKAIELAERRPAQFDRAVAERRLSALQPPPATVE